MTLGQKVEAKREALGLTKLELANRSGMHVSNIYNVASDKSSPSVFTASCIADALGLSLDYLTGRLPKDIDTQGLATSLRAYRNTLIYRLPPNAIQVLDPIVEAATELLKMYNTGMENY